MANNLGVAFSALFSISYKKTSVAATELEKISKTSIAFSYFRLLNMFNINILYLLLAILVCFKLIQDIVYSSLYATIIFPLVLHFNYLGAHYNC